MHLLELVCEVSVVFRKGLVEVERSMLWLFKVVAITPTGQSVFIL